MSFIRSALAAAAFLALSQGAIDTAFAAGNQDMLVLKLKDGNVDIQLRPDLAPKHVAQIEKLVRDGAYNGVAFHRVIPGFMAQTGDVQYGNMDKGYDPSRVGTGGSKYPNIPAEFSKEPFVRGTVGMAHPALTRTRCNGAENAGFPENWIPRFRDAYRIQDQAWIDGIRNGTPPADASTAWDGLVATCIADQIVEALATGRHATFKLPPRPRSMA